MSSINSEGLKPIYVAADHHRRILHLVSETEPTPGIGKMAEWLIDRELERRGLDPETLKPREADRSAAKPAAPLPP